MQEGDAHEHEAASHESAPDPSPEPTPDFETPGRGGHLKLIVGSILAVLILAGAAVAAYAALGLGKKKVSPSPEPTVLVTATPRSTPGARLNPGQQLARLEPVDNLEGSGEAARSAQPKHFVMAVSAKLPSIPAGAYYEVFLREPESETTFSAGKMYQVGENWVMTLDQARDASQYSDVLVSRETKDDGKPETIVLQGEFQG